MKPRKKLTDQEKYDKAFHAYYMALKNLFAEMERNRKRLEKDNLLEQKRRLHKRNTLESIDGDNHK